jgi:hypothetical protein
MANFYFLNTGDTAFNNGANWSTTDNGAPVNAIPANADDTFFTINSGDCIVGSTTVISTITFIGYTKTFTINATFTITNLMQVTSGNVLWAGSQGWTTRNFVNLGTTGSTTTLIAGKTYIVKEKYIRTTEKGSAHGKVISSVPGTKAILTVAGNTNIGYIDFTDIDAHFGRPLYPFNGLVNNCDNIFPMTDIIYPANRTAASSIII